MGVLSDLINSGENAVKGYIQGAVNTGNSSASYPDGYPTEDPYSTSNGGSSAFGSEIFQAIYAYGAGKTDQARSKLVNYFLKTGEGKKAQTEGIKQTLQQYLPFIIVGVFGVLILGVLLGRR